MGEGAIAGMMAQTTPHHGVVVYATTSAAMRSEKVLRRAGYRVKIVPVPRSLSTDCCLGLRFPWDQREQIEKELRRTGVEYVAVYPFPS